MSHSPSKDARAALLRFRVFVWHARFRCRAAHPLVAKADAPFTIASAWRIAKSASIAHPLASPCSTRWPRVRLELRLLEHRLSLTSSGAGVHADDPSRARIIAGSSRARRRDRVWTHGGMLGMVNGGRAAGGDTRGSRRGTTLGSSPRTRTALSHELRKPPIGTSSTSRTTRDPLHTVAAKLAAEPACVHGLQHNSTQQRPRSRRMARSRRWRAIVGARAP